MCDRLHRVWILCTKSGRGGLTGPEESKNKADEAGGRLGYLRVVEHGRKYAVRRGIPVTNGRISPPRFQLPNFRNFVFAISSISLTCLLSDSLGHNVDYLTALDIRQVDAVIVHNHLYWITLRHKNSIIPTRPLTVWKTLAHQGYPPTFTTPPLH